MNKSIFLPIIFFNFFVKWENMSGDALDMEAIKRILSRMTDMSDRNLSNKRLTSVDGHQIQLGDYFNDPQIWVNHR